jgi:excisionase family DNA binding protein
MSDRLLTLDEVAAWLRCSHRTVQRIVAKGHIRIIYVGRSRRVRESELLAYLASPMRERLT